MEKRLLLAIALSTLILVVYYSAFKPVPPAGRQLSEAIPGEEVPEQEETETDAKETPALPVPVKGEDIVVETGLYRLVLTTCGAKIKSFRLKRYPEIWKSEKDIGKEIDAIEKKLSKNRLDMLKLERKIKDESGGMYASDPVRENDRLGRDRESLIQSREALLSFIEERQKRMIRAEEIEAEMEEARLEGDYEKGRELQEKLEVVRGVELIPSRAQLYGSYPLALSFPDLKVDFDNVLFGCDSEGLNLLEDRKATLQFEAEAEGVILKKIFAFSQEDYVIGLDVVVENNSGDPISDERAMLLYGPGVGLVEESQVRGVVKRIASYISGRPKATFESVEGRRASIAPGKSVLRTGDFEWVALRNKYFAAALILPPECKAIRLESLAGGGQRIGVRLPEFNLNNGEKSSTNFKIYLGPQRVEQLREAGQSLDRIMDYGFWGPIAKVLDYFLKVFFRYAKNYGWAIIMLSLFIKIVFYPLTHRSFEGMHKMQEDMKRVQPKMEALKEKYKGNQQKVNKATMELYRKEGVNPLRGCGSGCFPMLLQMPVFFALYVVLYNAIDLRGAHFIGWITDLSSPDPMFVLPILMGGSMFWQQKLTGMGGMGGGGMGATGAQKDQQKMMKWMMPAFLTFIFFRLPAGVVLYWLIFNVFTGLQQFLIMKKKKKKAEKAGEE